LLQPHLPGWQGTQKSNLAQKARYANHKIAASRVFAPSETPLSRRLQPFNV
jgi:hypothetical protein